MKSLEPKFSFTNDHVQEYAHAKEMKQIKNRTRRAWLKTELSHRGLSRYAVSGLLAVSIVFLTGCGSSKSESQASGTAANGVQDLTGFKLTCSEASFVTLLNLYRQSQGLRTLRAVQSATLSSRFHANDMMTKDYFSHSEPDGRSFDARAAAFGYAASGENIAAGMPDANATFCQWKNSAGHNANMLGNFRTTGIGRATGGGMYGTYWSSNFGQGGADLISEPLTIEPCILPTTVPAC